MATIPRPKHDDGRHQFTLDDETYLALLRLTEYQNSIEGQEFLLADDYLKALVTSTDAEIKPKKSILEKIAAGVPLERLYDD